MVRCRGLLGCLLLTAVAAAASDMPVFRYALEHWTPHPFNLVATYPPAQSQAVQALLAKLPTNAALVVIGRPVPDAASATFALSPDTDDDEDDDASDSDATPWLSRPLTAEALQRAIDSPARQELVRRLLAGDSAVWVLVDSGDAAADDAAAKLLGETLDKLSGTLFLSAVGGDDDGDTPAAPTVEVPLRLAFSVLRLGAQDAAEADFIALLRRAADVPEATDAPVAVPVFGRGRVLDGLVGEGIAAANVTTACQYLVGPCTNEDADANPGFDLPLVVDWTKQLPPGNQPAESVGSPTAAAAAPALPVVDPFAQPDHTARNLALAIAALVLAVGGGLLFIWRSRHARQ